MGRSSRGSVVVALVVALGMIAAPAWASPPNDAFAAAIALSVDETFAGTTNGATLDPTEPVPSCASSTGATVWFSLTVAEPLAARADTFGSKFDTVLAAYRGETPATLTEIACNDDATDLGSLQSRITLDVEAGETVFLQVGGYDGASGPLAVTVRGTVAPLIPDDFADALEITDVPFSTTIDTRTATAEPGEPDDCIWSLERSVWLRYTPPEDAGLEASTAGSTFDTMLAVYRGTGFADLELVGCNDDSDWDLTSLVAFRARAGETYYFQIDGYGSASGIAVFSLESFEPPANDDFANATLLDGIPDRVTGTNVGASRETGEPLACGAEGDSVWYRFTAAEQVPAVIAVQPENWSFWPVVSVYRGDDVDSLTLVSCDYYNGRAGFLAQAGTTYHVQVASYWAGWTGPFELRAQKGVAVSTLVSDTWAHTDDEEIDAGAWGYGPFVAAGAESRYDPDEGGYAAGCAIVVLVWACEAVPLPRGP